MKLLSVVGARPQFIKLAPLSKALETETKKIKHVVVHSGQHYDYNMSKIFFDELRIPKVKYHLNVGASSHGHQTAEMLKRIEDVLIRENPDWVIVYGDTNTTLAAAVAAAKLNLPVAHVEAGLRSFNWGMPEEINRVMTDSISSISFCPSRTAMSNLRQGGHRGILVNCGDIMYDAMLLSLKIAKKRSQILQKKRLSAKGYYLATIHRAENTNDIRKFGSIVRALLKIGKKDRPVVWPAHPRTAKWIKKMKKSENLMIIDPVSYFDMLILEKNALKVFTDSGGIQKEAYWLKVPCITLRSETEWVETTKCGANVLAGTDSGNIIRTAGIPNRDFTFDPWDMYGTGDASKKIIAALKRGKI